MYDTILNFHFNIKVAFELLIEKKGVAFSLVTSGKEERKRKRKEQKAIV